MGIFERFNRNLSVKRDLGAGVSMASAQCSLALVRRESGKPASLQHAQTAANPDLLSGEIADGQLNAVDCTGVLGMDDYQLLLVETADVPESELRAAMRWRVKDLLDMDVEQAIIDVFPVPGRSGEVSNMVYVVAARRDLVGAVVERLGDAGLQLSAIDIPELALRNVARLLPEDVAGVALLYLDTTSGLITVTHQGTLYLTRRVHAGTEFLDSRGDAPLDDELRAWLDNIIIELQRSLDYYESHFAQAPASALVLAPLPVRIEGLCDYLSSQLGIRVRELEIPELIDVEETAQAGAADTSVLALGAALRQEGQS